MEIFPPSVSTATGTAQLQRTLECQLTPDEPCHKIITIKTIQEYESCTSLTSSESEMDLFQRFKDSFSSVFMAGLYVIMAWPGLQLK